MRHPHTSAADENRCAGHTDVPLSSQGEKSLSGLAEQVETAISPDIIVTSDRQCCSRLGLELYLRLGRSFQTSPLWREQDFGQWEGRTWDEIESANPTEFKQWTSDRVSVSPPEGESFLALRERVLSALAFVQGTDAKCALVVTHLGPIQALFCSIIEKAFEFDAEYGSIHQLRE